jgi:hypothetical protein
MTEAGNVALAAQLTPTDTTKNPLDSVHVLQRKPRSDLRIPSYSGALAPIPSFQKGAAAFGGTNVRADRDGVVRRLPLVYRLSDSLLIPNFGLAGIRGDSSGENASSLLSELPLGPSGSFLLYWYGPGGVNGVFKDQYISIKSLIVSAAQLQLGQDPDVPPSRFKDKTVIVGATAAGLYDLHSTPVGVKGTSHGGGGDYPGMEIFATFLSNVYHRNLGLFFGAAPGCCRCWTRRGVGGPDWGGLCRHARHHSVVPWSRRGGVLLSAVVVAGCGPAAWASLRIFCNFGGKLRCGGTQAPRAARALPALREPSGRRRGR